MSGASPVRRASLALALTVLLAPEPARACGCAVVVSTDLERCRTASRVFAGTVDSYEWPPAYRATAERSTEVHLAVDTVWRGEVPARLVVEIDPLGGPGTCTFYPPPGQRILVCDDGRPLHFSFCQRPALGARAQELSAALGPGAAPTAEAAPRRPWWLDRARLADSAEGVVLLVAPFVAALLGAAAGAVARRLRPPPDRPPRSVRRSLGVLLVVALLVVVARLVLHASLPKDALLFRCVLFGPAAVAAALGLTFAASEQRRGRGPAFAFAVVVTALIAGYARLHSPWQPDDAVACSEARARAHLRALSDMPRDAWVQQAPASCVDWGLSRVRADPRGPSVVIPDGRGGEHWLFASGEENYRWELP